MIFARPFKHRFMVLDDMRFNSSEGRRYSLKISVVVLELEFAINLED